MSGGIGRGEGMIADSRAPMRERFFEVSWHLRGMINFSQALLDGGLLSFQGNNCLSDCTRTAHSCLQGRVIVFFYFFIDAHDSVPNLVNFLRHFCSKILATSYGNCQMSDKWTFQADMIFMNQH